MLERERDMWFISHTPHTHTHTQRERERERERERDNMMDRSMPLPSRGHAHCRAIESMRIHDQRVHRSLSMIISTCGSEHVHAFPCLIGRPHSGRQKLGEHFK